MSNDEPLFAPAPDVAPSTVELSERRNHVAHKAAIAAKKPTLVVRDAPPTRTVVARKARAPKAAKPTPAPALARTEEPSAKPLGGRTMTPENAAAWAELQRLGHCNVKSRAAVEAMRTAASKIGRKIDSRWHAEDGVANVVLRSETAPAAEATRASAAPAVAKSSTPKAAPKAALKPERASATPESSTPTSPTSPIDDEGFRNLKVTRTPGPGARPVAVGVDVGRGASSSVAIVVIQSGTRIEIHEGAVVTVQEGRVRIEPAGGVR